MKNKLLLTTALISGLSVIGSASFAETKITGEIKTGYKSGEAISTTVGSNSGFFRESQLNVTKWETQHTLRPASMSNADLRVSLAIPA